MILFQKGSPTTPYGPPQLPQTKTVAAPKKRQHRKVVVKKQEPKPVVVVPRFTDSPSGYGDRVASGDVVTIHFLIKKENGASLADSKKRGLPYTFKIGAPGNDPLLDMVVTGMKVGAVRTGKVTAQETYGPTGFLPMVQPTDTFTVTISLIKRGDK